MRTVIVIGDTRRNGEDFALTPYLFLVKNKNFIGFGLCWGYKAIAITVAHGLPVGYRPKVIVYRKDTK